MVTLTLAGIRRAFGRTGEVVALGGIDLTVRQGDFVSIEGESGSGKSSLLGVAGLLDAPTAGDYLIDDVPTSSLRADDLARKRSETFAYIFQAFHLLERRPALDSVALPLVYRGLPRRIREHRARNALAQVGLADFTETPGGLLSGGQRQRVAIARALAANAPVLVADEPTGNLDTHNTEKVMDAIDAVHASGATVVLVTHSERVAARADRRIMLSDGRIVHDTGTTDAAAPSGVPPAPPGRASRVRFSTLLADACQNILARPGRLAGFLSAIAVAVALIVVTLGLSTSAAQQVTDLFDAQASREVTVVLNPATPDDPETPTDMAANPPAHDLRDRLSDLNGVVAAAATTQRENVPVSTGFDRPSIQGLWVEVDGDPAVTGRLRILDGSPYAQGPLASGQALVGSALAQRLDLADVSASPSIVVSGTSYEVVGVIEDSPREADWVGAVLTAPQDEPQPGLIGDTGTTSARMLLTTRLGAARQVAHEAPLVVDPSDPQSVTVHRPPDPSQMRAGIESSVRATMILLTAVVLAGSLLSVTLTSLSAAAERRVEFGLRRAVGARARHIAGMLTCESAVLGIVGAGVGLALGLAAILVVTIVNRWTPIFDPTAAAIALAAGIAVSIFGSLLGALRAVRAQPNDTLRPHV